MTKKELKRRKQLKLDMVRILGFNPSRWDNIFYSNNNLNRVKFNKNKFRIETKSSAGWVRINSYYYKDITIINDKLVKIGGIK